jgi:tRNA(Arg) A34 adenosine deaminase TadA/NAD(P)-dependent dehydrogenase (short-subunit alcohol dehydrogenase family)
METVLVIGASGTIGSAVAQKLRENYEVLTASRCSGDFKVDLAAPETVRALDELIPQGVDHVVICAGASQYGAIGGFDADAWSANMESKLSANTRTALLLINDMRLLRDGGSITLTAGMASRMSTAAMVGLAVNNAGIEAFVRCAGVDLPRNLRLNALSPGLVKETVEKKITHRYTDLIASQELPDTVPVSVCVRHVCESVAGPMTGVVFDAPAEPAAAAPPPPPPAAAGDEPVAEAAAPPATRSRQQLAEFVDGFVPSPDKPDDPAALRALKQGLLAAGEGTYGVGAVIVDGSGAVVCEGANGVFAEGFHSDLHAEMVVLNEFEAAMRLRPGTLPHKNAGDYTLVSSLEPCPMCMTRIIFSGIGHIRHVCADDIGGMVQRRHLLPPVFQEITGKQGQQWGEACCSEPLRQCAFEIWDESRAAVDRQVIERSTGGEVGAAPVAAAGASPGVVNKL